MKYFVFYPIYPNDKVYHLLPYGGCPGTLTSSTTKTGRHDIAEILLKVALKTPKIKNKSTLMSC
jgi:hypothetical protein